MNTTPPAGEESPRHGLQGLESVATPWGVVSRDDLTGSERAARDHIIDVVRGRFAAQGISAVSMAELAKAAGISRAWLYRNFSGRDAIVRALLVREAQTFAERLIAADRPDRSVEESVTETFVYIIRRGQRDRMFHEVLIEDTGSVAQWGAHALETYLVDQRAALPRADGRIAAEVIVRLIVSILTTPRFAMDFDSDKELRSFADRVIPPLLTQAGADRSQSRSEQ